MSIRHFISVFTLVPLFLSGVDCLPEFNAYDVPFVEQITASKRTIPLDEKGEGLRLSGDIRAEWQYRYENLNHRIFRGHGATDSRGIPIPSCDSAVRLNFRADYKCKDFYAVAQIEWDDILGTFVRNPPCDTECQKPFLFGSGTCDYLCLKRMYVGGVIWESECGQKIWVDIGRKSLYFNFDSRIQYKARVDGIFSEYSYKYAEYEDKRSSEFALRGAYFLVDQKSNHFAWVYEARFYNIKNSGFDLKYSMIDWNQKGKNACGEREPLGWRFLNSQITLDYNFKEKLWGKKVNLYSAALMNHNAKPISIYLKDGVPFLDIAPGTYHIGAENIGAYLGFIIGEVTEAGDWSFDCNYQYVQAQAVPDCDSRGIGTGNFRKENFAEDRRGNGNYKGIHAEFLYAITKNLQLDIQTDFSGAINHIFGPHNYRKVEIELIHSF